MCSSRATSWVTVSVWGVMRSLLVIVLLALVVFYVQGIAAKPVVTPRPKKLGVWFMVKSFFGTLIDPTSLDSVKHAPIDRTSSSGKSKKGKGSKLGAFPAMGGGGMGGGAVCGPNGCT